MKFLLAFILPSDLGGGLFPLNVYGLDALLYDRQTWKKIFKNTK